MTKQVYESLLHIDLSSRIGRGWLLNRYRIHQRLHLAFPGGVKQRILFAVLSPAQIHVRHAVEADWRKAFADLPILQRHRAVSATLKPVEGEVYVFSLEASPVKMEVKTRKRTALRDGDLHEWLARKMGQAGAKVLEARISPVRRVISRGAQEYIHPSAYFLGRLEVVRPEAFARAYAAGIGPAKGFGFGMLRLARE